MMLTFRFVPLHSVYHTVLYSALFRPLLFSFEEENNSNVGKANTCVGTVFERSNSRTYEGIYIGAVETVWHKFIALDK